MKRLLLALPIALSACGDAPDTPDKPDKNKDKEPELIRECRFSDQCTGKKGVCWHKTFEEWICVECVRDDECDHEGAECVDNRCRL